MEFIDQIHKFPHSNQAYCLLLCNIKKYPWEISAFIHLGKYEVLVNNTLDVFLKETWTSIFLNVLCVIWDIL